MKFEIVILLALMAGVIRAADDCADTSTSCAEWAKNADFCNNCFYSCDNRIKYCAKTCGYCGDDAAKCKDCSVTTLSTTPTTPSTTTGPCFDLDPASCKQWNSKGFCTNPWYKCVNKVQFCAKTCGFCSPGSCVDN